MGVGSVWAVLALGKVQSGRMRLQASGWRWLAFRQQNWLAGWRLLASVGSSNQLARFVVNWLVQCLADHWMSEAWC